MQHTVFINVIRVNCAGSRRPPSSDASVKIVSNRSIDYVTMTGADHTEKQIRHPTYRGLTRKRGAVKEFRTAKCRLYLRSISCTM